ncbi:MAG: hypothetical protein V9E94_03460 [Microthrixaceae bacterium]
MDGEGRLVHLAWAPRPAGAADDDVIDGRNGFKAADSVASFERQTRRDEFLTFGDVTYHEVSLKASFASLPRRPLAAQRGAAPADPRCAAALRRPRGA